MSVHYKLNNKTIFTFTDKLLDDNNLGTFKRTIKKPDNIFCKWEFKIQRKSVQLPNNKQINW